MIQLGRLTMGGSEPVRIQSMTNTPTSDVEQTVGQVLALADAGCELVRMTVRNTTEAYLLEDIRNRIERAGVHIPLAADIHFKPRLAEIAASMVHKVRINPGNYLDRQYFLSKETGAAKHDIPDYEREANVIKLLDVCRKHNTAIRVGVNHGSLSERILHKYGNTAEGMVASAMEFLEICRRHDFHNIVVSMKSSHVKTMLQATIGIVGAMIDKGMDYPMHLGVTEAGEGFDGRIRSAAGIGPLLANGLGDTVRVSLTEDPVAEIPVARKLLALYAGRRERPGTVDQAMFTGRYRREVSFAGIFDKQKAPLVVAADSEELADEHRPDLMPVSDNMLADREGNQYRTEELPEAFPEEADAVSLRRIAGAGKVLLYNVKGDSLESLRKVVAFLSENGITAPLVLQTDYSETDRETLLLKASSGLAGMMLEGIADACRVTNQGRDSHELTEIVFGVLQSTGLRISGTQYISCPGCGRTSYDMQSVLKQIKQHTSGMKNVTIAVMGCIVNGPGEMAGADYGYVGEGNGRISLYHRGKRVKRNIDQRDALKELLKLIDEAGS